MLWGRRLTPEQAYEDRHQTYKSWRYSDGCERAGGDIPEVFVEGMRVGDEEGYVEGLQDARRLMCPECNRRVKLVYQRNHDLGVWSHRFDMDFHPDNMPDIKCQAQAIVRDLNCRGGDPLER